MSETLSASTVTQERHLAFAVALMEHLAVPTFVLDAAHRVLVWNEACERLTALPASQMLGTDKHWQAFYEEPRACLADLVLQRNFDQGKPLYARFFDSYSVGGGVYAESWCWLPHRGQRRYLPAASLMAWWCLPALVAAGWQALNLVIRRGLTAPRCCLPRASRNCAR